MENNKEVNIPEQLTPVYDKLIAKGEDEIKAADFVGEMWAEIDNLQVQLGQLTDFNEDMIEQLCSLKIANYVYNQEAKEIPYGMIKTIGFMNAAAKEVTDGKVNSWFSLTEEERLDIGWRIGYNTKEYKLYTDVGCYTFNDMRNCGVYIYGSERTDKAWRNALGNEGQWLASEEVKYIDDEDTLAGFRNNKDWDTIASKAVKKDVDRNCDKV
jgi:hypothetical protein